MTTRLIYLVLLIVCFSCGTNNKPLSEAQKEKIKGEIKEVVNTFNKGCEEANPDLIIPLYHDAHNFIYVVNGKIFNYQEAIDTMKHLFATLINQKATIVSEDYIVLDNTSVIFTENTKWTVNFKDGHILMQDPWIMQWLFKKVDDKWRIVSGVESGYEKSIPSEGSKKPNQVELMKKQVGYWKCDDLKDTIQFYETKAYGNGYDNNYKQIVNGRIVFESKDLWSYDKDIDKYIWILLSNNSDSEIRLIWYTSENNYEVIRFKDAAFPEKADWKIQGEFKSPKIIEETTLRNNKPVGTAKWTRIK